MKREIYYGGVPGVKWGIWNAQRKNWQFDVSEDSPMLAKARLFQKIGEHAKKGHFEPRQLPALRRKGSETVEGDGPDDR